MIELNQWKLEIERLEKAAYDAADKAIHRAYKDALKEIKAKLADYVARYDQLSFSKRLEVERLFDAAKAIDGILAEASGNVRAAVIGYGEKAAELGYMGTWYAMEGAEHIQMNLPGLDGGFIAAVINKPVAGKTLSQRMYTNRRQIASRATQAIYRGLAEGEGYKAIAGRISALTEANYKQSLRIARTEGGRIRSEATLESYAAARDAGVDFAVMWMSTLDYKTRDDHQALDAQIADEDGLFHVHGYSAKGPRLFGVAAEDINCRCTTAALVNGVAPSLRLDNETGVLVECRSYADWKKNKGLTGGATGGNVRSITLDGLKAAAAGAEIADEVLETIYAGLKTAGAEGIFDAVVVRGLGPGIVMQTDPTPEYGMTIVKLVINRDVVAGKTVAGIDAVFAGTDITRADSLIEGAYHEATHAKLIEGMSDSEIGALYDTLGGIHIDGVSKIATLDGAECIADVGAWIIRQGGSREGIPQAALALYDKYLGGKK